MVKKTELSIHADDLAHSLATSGLRFTRQRREVFDVVQESDDHPTAEDIFQRAKSRMPEISFATVYNCLDVLVECGLVRQVSLERGPSRFCPNRREHCHFHCSKCGEVTDIYIEQELNGKIFTLPTGFKLDRAEIALTGLCSGCARTRQ